MKIFYIKQDVMFFFLLEKYDVCNTRIDEYRACFIKLDEDLGCVCG